MKKILFVILALVLCACLFAGCGDDNDAESAKATDKQSVTEAIASDDDVTIPDRTPDSTGTAETEKKSDDKSDKDAQSQSGDAGSKSDDSSSSKSGSGSKSDSGSKNSSGSKSNSGSKKSGSSDSKSSTAEPEIEPTFGEYELPVIPN